MTPKVMWMDDLAEFEKEWLAVLDAEANAPKEKTVANASKAGKGKGKAVEKKGNSIQEAFAKQEPLKLAAGADIASSPPAVKKAASKSAAPAAAKGKAKAAATTKAKTASPAAKPKRKTFVYDDDLEESEVEMTLHDDDSVEQSSAASDSDVSEVQIKASTRRRAVLDEDESDADMAPAAKGKAKAIKEDTDDEGEEEEFSKPIAPAKRKTASKVVDLESSSDAPVDDSDEDDFIVRPAKKRK